jgi:hypothetical protein
MSFYGRAVAYTENGREVDALVLQEHGRLASHLGGAGQPLCHLLILDVAKENLNSADPASKVMVRHDVPHASHVFSEDDKKRYGVSLLGGRWSEFGTSPIAIWESAKSEEKREAEEEHAQQ